MKESRKALNYVSDKPDPEPQKHEAEPAVLPDGLHRGKAVPSGTGNFFIATRFPILGTSPNQPRSFGK